ncbi:CASP-like protein 1 [Bidens hawaiensis]|uniref:CASP-like protein 1 n=1 Tax=Bidens hawaiensis TaxID=980011 RepID=UPI00404AD513
MAAVNPSHSPVSVDMPAPEPDYKGGMGTGAGAGVKYHVVIDVVLRVVLFATALVAVIVMVTSKQTKLIPVAQGMTVSMVANFNQSPAFIYYVAALSVACLCGIITGAFALVNLKRGSTKLMFHIAILDTLLLGILASATGAAGAVGYIGYKGNSHTRWNKVCNVFGTFCGHIAGSVSLSLLPPLALLLLVWLSFSVFSKKIRLN